MDKLKLSLDQCYVSVTKTLLKFFLGVDQFKTNYELKFGYSQLYHVLIIFWHLFSNYHLFTLMGYILFNRHDIVFGAVVCGFGLQYLTLWNLAAQQNYFLLSYLEDGLHMLTDKESYTSLKNTLHTKLSYYFYTAIFPMSFMIVINYWSFHCIDLTWFDEFNAVKGVFGLKNHLIHTVVAPIVVGERVFKHREHPGDFEILTRCVGICLWYGVVCEILYFLTSTWPYPMIHHMSSLGMGAYLTTLGLVGFSSHLAAGKIGQIWTETKFSWKQLAVN